MHEIQHVASLVCKALEQERAWIAHGEACVDLATRIPPQLAGGPPIAKSVDAEWPEVALCEERFARGFERAEQLLGLGRG